MTKLLEQAFEEAATFPSVDQDGFAWCLLDELHSCEDDRPAANCKSDDTWTPLLRYAFGEASRLNDEGQDEAARFLMEDIADERQWAESFAKSGDFLDRWADKVSAEYKAGHTRPLDPDAL